MRFKLNHPSFQPTGHWFYWEVQDPHWWRLLTFLITIGMAVLAVVAIQHSEWPVVVLVVLIVVFLVSVYGGFHVVVAPGRLTIHSGSLGLPLQRLKLANVKSVEVVTFSPWEQFGWGLYRYSPDLRAWSFNLSGNSGVMFYTKK